MFRYKVIFQDGTIKYVMAIDNVDIYMYLYKIGYGEKLVREIVQGEYMPNGNVIILPFKAKEHKEVA